MGALQTPEEISQAMERIEKEAIRMGGLVEDLLELARLDETKPLALAPVDLVPLARDAALDAMASSPGRTVTVVVAPQTDSGDTVETPDIDPAQSNGQPNTAANPTTGPIAFASALARFRSRKPRRTDAPASAAPTPAATEPAGPIPAVVMADENKIRQVITNLMGNAQRFTSVDTPIELEVAVDPRRQRASIAVVDHGEGVAPQIREKIFQRFWRADTSRTRETGGSGLGLAIVASIVATHNGTVEVVETPGGGATFRVWFPLAASPSAPQSIAPARTS
jgi:two-component system OmpR family sensor kinase